MTVGKGNDMTFAGRMRVTGGEGREEEARKRGGKGERRQGREEAREREGCSMLRVTWTIALT